MQKLIIIGAGGYAKSVVDSIDTFNYEIVGFVDEFSNENTHIGYPILAKTVDNLLNPSEYVYFIAIGNNKNRKRWFDYFAKRSLRLINVVDKSAIVSARASIGVGCFVGKMAIINSKAVVGDDCIVNTKSLVEHGCKIGSHVNVSTNAVLNGDVAVGDGAFVGSCSVTIGQLSIGGWSTVGAGAVVINDVPSNVIVAGVPAKFIKTGAMLG